jgi:hypothetical protein
VCNAGVCAQGKTCVAGACTCDPSACARPGCCGATGLVLFGGNNGQSSGGQLGDTWTWDGTAWTHNNVLGPSERDQAVMAYLGGKVVLVGGYNGNNTQGLDDTWEWDGASWTQKVVLLPGKTFGGVGAVLGSKIELIGEKTSPWEFDGANWTARSVAGPSAFAGFGLATLSGKIVLYGGLAAQPVAGSPIPMMVTMDETWEWDGASWTKRDVSGPGPRTDVGMATLNGKIVLFGGVNEDGSFPPTYDPATWVWDGAAWTKLDIPGPSGRTAVAMATFGGKIVLFGGYALGTSFGDTWEFDGAAWTQRQVAGPSARSSAVMVGP